MNNEKTEYQLFIGKVAEELGMEKTTELLKETKQALEPTEKHEKEYPTMIEEVKDRVWFIDDEGKVKETFAVTDINNLSTKSRAKAFLALMQLVEYRDAWNQIDGFVADWSINNDQVKHVIEVSKNELEKSYYYEYQSVLYFGSEETRDKFMNQFSDLIEEAKELL